MEERVAELVEPKAREEYYTHHGDEIEAKFWSNPAEEKAAKIAIRAVLNHDARHVEGVFLCCHKDAEEMFMMCSFVNAELQKQDQMRNN